MKKRVLLLFCLSFFLFSCKTIDLEKEMIDAQAPKEEEVVEKVEEVNRVVPVEPFIYEKTKYIVIDKKEAENKGLTGKDAVRQSMKDSMVTLENFTGGTSFYDYDENRQFPIFTKLLSLTTIMLNDDEYMDCIEICPDDLEKFPEHIKRMKNNTFLMHGYMSFHHLLLARSGDKARTYLLGVPGTFRPTEQMMASMYGFNSFKNSHRSDMTLKCFGYWYIVVQV